MFVRKEVRKQVKTNQKEDVTSIAKRDRYARGDLRNPHGDGIF
jgi:hypothetical protein